MSSTKYSVKDIVHKTVNAMKSSFILVLINVSLFEFIAGIAISVTEPNIVNYQVLDVKV